MSSYRIRSGDTLSGIAARFHTTVGALARTNHLANPNLIIAGRTLQVPGHSTQDSFHPAPHHPASHHPAPAAHHAAPAQHTSSATHGVHGSTALAHAGRSVALSMGGYRGLGLCATGVSRAIQRTYGIKVWGNGNQIDNNLPRSKFRQVNLTLAQALKIPGLILTWEHTPSRLGSIYGHTAITQGDGRSSTSDFIERDTLHSSAGRTGLKVFMPIG